MKIVYVLLVSRMDEPNTILGVFDDENALKDATHLALMDNPDDNVWSEKFFLNSY